MSSAENTFIIYVRLTSSHDTELPLSAARNLAGHGGDQLCVGLDEKHHSSAGGSCRKLSVSCASGRKVDALRGQVAGQDRGRVPQRKEVVEQEKKKLGQKSHPTGGCQQRASRRKAMGSPDQGCQTASCCLPRWPSLPEREPALSGHRHLRRGPEGLCLPFHPPEEIWPGLQGSRFQGN